MKIILLSNYFNHHQTGISRELAKKTKHFEFIATSKMREERKKLGYGENYIPPYVTELDCNNKENILRNIEDADVVIRGSAPFDLIKKRLSHNKLIFRYAERQFKKKELMIKFVPRFVKWHIQNPLRKPIYLLSASAYAVNDFSKFCLFKNKAYKWGYFPETKYYDDVKKLIKQKNKQTILWCGRFIDWKHPDDVIEIGRRLRDAKYSFEINFVGTGIMEEEIIKLAKGMGLNDQIHFLGAMKPEMVRKQMEKSAIFLMTSDKNEGWGAVLNEAMNSGCVVIASHLIGSVPFLIENNKNGMIYKSGDIDQLFEKVKMLLDDENKQDELGFEAYKTITELWNAEVAVERLLCLSENIINGDRYPDLYKTGPCSKADVLEDNWFYE